MKSALVLAVLVAPAVAMAITPLGGVTPSGTTIVINATSGDQTDPHVSADTAVYTNSGGASSSIRYYNFVTTGDQPVPNPNNDIDLLSDVNGSKIAFSRVRTDGRTACMVYDVSTSAMIDVAPVAGSTRFGAVLGSHVVAFTEFSSGNGDIMVYDLSTSGPLINLSPTMDVDQNASIAEGGSAVVWEHCVGSNCDILYAVGNGSNWSSAAVVSATSYPENNPDTDGKVVVYDSSRPSATGQDIYFQQLYALGNETQLEISGLQRNPSVKSGLVAFESTRPASGALSDIYIYVIATNTIYQVTNTPSVDETLNDVTVVADGVRIVWAADDDVIPGNHNVYARTLMLPLPPACELPQLQCPFDIGCYLNDCTNECANSC